MSEIAPGVHLVDGLFRAPGASNAYLLVGETLALVDTGLPGSLRPIRRYVESLGRRLEELSHILLTHGHPDHTGGAAFLRSVTGARVYVHAWDTRRIKGTGQMLCYGPFGRLPLNLPLLRRVRADAVLQDGDTLPELGGVRVHHTPGHTPGSVCYEVQEAGVLLTGDMLICRGAKVGKNHAYPGSERRAYQQSLEKIRTLDIEWLCPGHGRPLQVANAQQWEDLTNPLQGYDWTWRAFGR